MYKVNRFCKFNNDFTDQPKVINGASDLIALVFGKPACIQELL